MASKKDNADMIDALPGYQSETEVLEEAKHILDLMKADIDFAVLDKAFADTCALFRGKYAGYRACTNAYHDLDHTLHVFLAMVQLLHGAEIKGKGVSGRSVIIGIVCSLFHDIGFIQAEGDTEGTGAKYTSVHEDRGVDFMQTYFREHGFSKEEIEIARTVILGTNLRQSFVEIPFPDDEAQTLAQLLGTADILGQMGDRRYLEKLPQLYKEFVEARIEVYDSELDLLDKTIDFWKHIQKRLKNELGSTNTYVRAHFKARYSLDRDLYLETIERNIRYLKKILAKHRDSYLEYLRRESQIR